MCPGEGLLSRAVNVAIGFKPLYTLMKVGAKHVLQSTAERNGVPWRATVRQLENTPEVERPLPNSNFTREDSFTFRITPAETLPLAG